MSITPVSVNIAAASLDSPSPAPAGMIAEIIGEHGRLRVRERATPPPIPGAGCSIADSRKPTLGLAGE